MQFYCKMQYYCIFNGGHLEKCCCFQLLMCISGGSCCGTGDFRWAFLLPDPSCRVMCTSGCGPSLNLLPLTLLSSLNFLHLERCSHSSFFNTILNGLFNHKCTVGKINPLNHFSKVSNCLITTQIQKHQHFELRFGLGFIHVYFTIKWIYWIFRQQASYCSSFYWLIQGLKHSHSQYPKHFCSLYADDTVIYCSAPSPNQALFQQQPFFFLTV